MLQLIFQKIKKRKNITWIGNLFVLFLSMKFVKKNHFITSIKNFHKRETVKVMMNIEEPAKVLCKRVSLNSTFFFFKEEKVVIFAKTNQFFAINTNAHFSINFYG